MILNQSSELAFANVIVSGSFLNGQRISPPCWDALKRLAFFNRFPPFVFKLYQHPVTDFQNMLLTRVFLKQILSCEEMYVNFQPC